MHRRHSTAVAIGLACAALLLGGTASAQEWLTLPDLSAQRGIAAGSFKFWPQVGVEGRYDSNVFNNAEDDAPGNDPKATALLRVLPGLRIDNPDFDVIHLTFQTVADIRQYFSEDPAISAQPQFGITADLGIDLFPRSVASFRLFDSFKDWLETPNFSTTQSFQRIYNKGGARVSLHPGGTAERRALDVSAQYAYVLDHFVDFEEFDKQAHEMNLLASWKFYPMTALFLDATFALESWDDPDPLRGRVDSMPLRTYLGLTGYITKRIATTLKVGYGQGFYDSGEDFQSVIGGARISWVPLATTILELGYDRDFVDSYYANYYVSDRIGLRFQQRLWERLTIVADGGYAFLNFAEYTPPANTRVTSTQRAEQALDVTVKLDVDIVRYVGVEVGYELQDVFSDFQQFFVDPATTQETMQDAGGYIRHQVYGSVIVRY